VIYESLAVTYFNRNRFLFLFIFCYYLRQGRYVFVVVYLSVCLSVSLLATLRENFQIFMKFSGKVACSALTLLVGRQEGHPARKKYGGDGGDGHWLVRMEWRPAVWSVCLPL